MSGRPTLDSVAQRARVSRQTVSNVINSPHVVRADTASRVLAAIDDLGYRPSRAARQLRTRRSMMLGLRVEPDRGGINGSVLDRFLHALVEGAQAASYRVVLYTAPDDAAEIAVYADLMQAGDLDGFVLTSTHHGDPRTSWLTEHRVPFTTFGRPWGAQGPPHSWVDVDGAAGTAEATRHLLAGGHRGIGFVGWPEGSGVGDDRRLGWRQAMADAGLATALDSYVEDGVDTGGAAAIRLLRGPDAPTAIVCASDSLALGVQRAAGDRVAVVGFDDTPVAATIGLSSVSQPLAAAAQHCLAQVLDQIAAPDAAPQAVLLAPALAVRTSTPPPQAAGPDPMTPRRARGP